MSSPRESELVVKFCTAKLDMHSAMFSRKKNEIKAYIVVTPQGETLVKMNDSANIFQLYM